MTRPLTETLCTHCGLCCDGTLFADVELESCTELEGLEILGLQVEEGDATPGLLSQPCTALDGRRCRIYAQRPGCCRTFECTLLQDVRGGVVSIDDARRQIRTTITRIERLRADLAARGTRYRGLPLDEQVAHAVARPSASPEERRRQLRLQARMTRLARDLERTFLGRAD